jgi:hypothetical protein
MFLGYGGSAASVVGDTAFNSYHNSRFFSTIIEHYGATGYTAKRYSDRASSVIATQITDDNTVVCTTSISCYRRSGN